MKTTETEITLIFDRHHDLTPKEKKYIYDKIDDFMYEISTELGWESIEMIFNHTGIRRNKT